ncbi:MAG: hypothetical protein WC516_01400 [Patescibacteria group bacterium]
MKKILFIIPIVALLALTGCFNKTQNQPSGQDNASNSQSVVTTSAPSDIYGDATLFGSKTLGWEIKFSESYNKVQCSDCIGGTYLLFGPIKPQPAPSTTTNSQAPAYTLNFSEVRPVGNEFDIIKANITMPETVAKSRIGNFDVLTWKDGGECVNRSMEVFGTKYSIVMSSLGCTTTEKEDFRYFENIVKNIKQLD